MGPSLPTDRVQGLEKPVASGWFASVDETLAALDRSEGEPWDKGAALKQRHARYPDLVDDGNTR